MVIPEDALAPYPWSGVWLSAAEVEIVLSYGPMWFRKDFTYFQIKKVCFKKKVVVDAC